MASQVIFAVILLVARIFRCPLNIHTLGSRLQQTTNGKNNNPTIARGRVLFRFGIKGQDYFSRFSYILRIVNDNQFATINKVPNLSIIFQTTWNKLYNACLWCEILEFVS